MLTMVGCAALAQHPVSSTITFVVRDDAGQVVTNALADGCFLDVTQSGARDRFNRVIDKNGCLVAKGSTFVGVYARFTCNGFYPTTVKEMIDYKQYLDRNGKLLPKRWDLEIPVLLKRIRHQIPMYQQFVVNPHTNMRGGGSKYLLSRSSGFDLLKGAFLPPYGNGEVADFAFDWKMTIYETDQDGLALSYGTRCEICLTNVVDGICRGKPDGSLEDGVGSRFISAYEAPLGGYQSQLSFHRNLRGSKVDSNDDKHYLYYFRIRTQTNEAGQVTNALYGKIQGRINENFTFYLNPTPNDRNIEPDLKKNLFPEER